MYEKILNVSEITAYHVRINQALGSLKKLGVRTCLLYQYINPLEANENIATFLLDTYRASLNRQKQLLTDEGFTVETVERGGLLSSRELFDLAREQGCSLVVTGLPRHTLVGGALFGGASSQLIYRATLPLLIIRPPMVCQEETRQQQHDPF
jgi:nucleotide-binding universal stress UspA family protein